MYRYVILGSTIYTTQLYTLLPLYNELSNLKRRYSNLILVAGGPHASGDPSGVLRLGFDIAFIGESEISFPSYLKSLIDGGDVFKTPGIAYLEDNRIRFNKVVRVGSLDEYPPYAVRAGLYNPIELTRGCPFGCGFCQVTRLFGVVPRHRSIDNVIENVECMIRVGVRDIRFITPNSLGYGSRDGVKPELDILEEFLSRLHNIVVSRYGGRIFYGSFPSEARPEFVSEDTARILKKYTSGKRVIIGAQSGSNRVLKLLNRGHLIEDVLNAVEILRRYDFRVDVDFIFGLPYEDDEDVELTIKAMERIIELGGIIHAHYFMPLPATPLFKYKPKPIHPKILKFLNKYEGRGRVFGYWRRQIDISYKILELIEKGVISSSFNRGVES